MMTKLAIMAVVASSCSVWVLSHGVSSAADSRFRIQQGAWVSCLCPRWVFDCNTFVAGASLGVREEQWHQGFHGT